MQPIEHLVGIWRLRIEGKHVYFRLQYVLCAVHLSLCTLFDQGAPDSGNRGTSAPALPRQQHTCFHRNASEVVWQVEGVGLIAVTFCKKNICDVACTTPCLWVKEQEHNPLYSTLLCWACHSLFQTRRRVCGRVGSKIARGTSNTIQDMLMDRVLTPACLRYM